MKANRNISNTVHRITLLGLLATLAACGGGGDEDSCGSQSIGEAFACALAESFNNAFNKVYRAVSITPN